MPPPQILPGPPESDPMHGNSCFGDLGGPGLYLRNKTWEVYGVMSEGPKSHAIDRNYCHHTHVEYALVPVVRAWIFKTVYEESIRLYHGE